MVDQAQGQAREREVGEAERQLPKDFDLDEVVDQAQEQALEREAGQGERQLPKNFDLDEVVEKSKTKAQEKTIEKEQEISRGRGPSKGFDFER